MPEQREDLVDAAVRRLLDDVAPMDDIARTHGRARLRAGIDAEEKGSLMSITEVRPDVRRPMSHRPQRRWLAAAAAVTAVAAAGIVIAQPEAPEDPQVHTAAQVLKVAASNIDPADQPGEGEYVYVRERSFFNGKEGRFEWRERDVTENWIPADRSDVWMLRIGREERTFLKGTEEQALEEGAIWPGNEPMDKRGKCGNFFPDEGGASLCVDGDLATPTEPWLRSLPDDPQRLLEFLRADLCDPRCSGEKPDDKPDVDTDLFNGAVESLRTGLWPPEERSMLFRALALLPGITIIDKRVNLDGRQGTALSRVDTHNNRRTDLIVDYASGDFIGTREIQVKTKRGTKAGSVLGVTAFHTAVVDDLGERP